MSFFPVILAGFYYLWRSKLSFGGLWTAGGALKD